MAEKKSLQTLSITVSPGYEPPEAGDPPSTSPPSTSPPPNTFPLITTLSLTKDQGSGTEYILPGLADFAASFPSLTSLTLEAFGESFGEAADFFAALPSPRLSHHLTFASDSNSGLPSHLLPFVGLVSLSLNRTNRVNGDLFDTLRLLPRLEELSICGGVDGYGDADVVIEDLVACVSPGRRKHQTLRRLRFDHFTSVCDFARVSEYGPHWNVKTSRWEAHENPASEQSELPGDLTRYDALLEGAEAGGVELTGSFREKLAILWAHEKEKELVKEKWGSAPPPFSSAEVAFYTQMRLPGQAWTGPVFLAYDPSDIGSE